MLFDGATRGAVRDALAAAYQTVFGMRDELAIEFGSAVTAGFDEHQGVQAYAMSVVAWAIREGYEAHLLRAARRFSDSPSLFLLEQQCLGSFKTEELMSLEKMLVKNTTAEVICEAALAALPPDARLPKRLADPEDATTAFRRVADHLASLRKQSDGSHPMCTFAEELGARCGHGADVKRWIAGLAKGLRSRRPVAANNFYLFVKFETKQEVIHPEGRVTVTMWLWQLDARSEPLKRIPECVCDPTELTLATCEQLLSGVRKNLFKRYRELRSAGARLTVAVCLTTSALQVAIENWRVMVGATPRPVGAEHHVVVRSFDRLYGDREDTWAKWAERWSQLKASAGDVVWFGEPHDVSKAYAPGVVCAALTETTCVSLVGATIDAGVPAVLWPRLAGVSASVVEQRLVRLITSRGISDLPEQLFRMRSDDANVDAEIREALRDFAILWDDHDRIPPDADPDAEYQAPTRR